MLPPTDAATTAAAAASLPVTSTPTTARVAPNARTRTYEQKIKFNHIQETYELSVFQYNYDGLTLEISHKLKPELRKLCETHVMNTNSCCKNIHSTRILDLFADNLLLQHGNHRQMGLHFHMEYFGERIQIFQEQPPTHRSQQQLRLQYHNWPGRLV